MSGVDTLSTATVVLMDLPKLPGDPDPERRYHLGVALDNPNSSFEGARLYTGNRPDGTLKRAGSLRAEADMGRCINGLPGTGPRDYWDRATKLQVQMIEGELSSATEQDVLEGANWLAVQAQTTGKWEVIAFCNAELLGEGRYRLSQIRRGLRGTEDCMAGHGSGDRVVALNNYVISVGYGVQQHNRQTYFKVVQAEDDPDLSPVVSAVLQSRDMMPFSPARLTGVRKGNGLSLTWLRRSREYFNVLELDKGAPLSEPTEEYEIELWQSGVLLRTLGVPSSQASIHVIGADWNRSGLTDGRLQYKIVASDGTVLQDWTSSGLEELVPEEYTVPDVRWDPSTPVTVYWKDDLDRTTEETINPGTPTPLKREAVYTSAQQTADGITPGSPVEVRVYQLNRNIDRTGRGVPAIITA